MAEIVIPNWIAQKSIEPHSEKKIYRNLRKAGNQKDDFP